MMTSILASILLFATFITPEEGYVHQDVQNEGLTLIDFNQILDFQDVYEQGALEIPGRNLKRSSRSVGKEIWKYIEKKFKGDVKAAFEHYDKDKNKKLGNEELHDLAHDLGYEHQPEREDDRFVDLVKEYFGGGDDKLTFRNWSQLALAVRDSKYIIASQFS